MIRAIVFDMDGVLVDTEPLHIRAWKRLFGGMGVEVSEQEYLDAIGVADDDFVRKLIARHGLSHSVHEICGGKNSIYKEILREEVRPFPGALELLQALDGQCPLALVSSSWRADVDIVLDKFGLRGFFKVVVVKEDVRKRKPDPEAFLMAAQALGVDAEACVAIEDSISGVTAAKAAGMTCLAVTSSIDAARLRHADLVLADIRQVGEWILRQEGITARQ